MSIVKIDKNLIDFLNSEEYTKTTCTLLSNDAVCYKREKQFGFIKFLQTVAFGKESQAKPNTICYFSTIITFCDKQIFLKKESLGSDFNIQKIQYLIDSHQKEFKQMAQSTISFLDLKVKI